MNSQIRLYSTNSRIAITACSSIFVNLGAILTNNLEDATVILISSDVDNRLDYPRLPHQILCDITAYGSSGPMQGINHSDGLIQALTGLAETTGDPNGAPTLCSLAVTEGLSALYATAAILIALLVKKKTGQGQEVEIALFDTAFTMLTTFLPFHFIDKTVTRSGNGHTLSCPWNIYKAKDAWLIICTGNNEQWRRLCNVMDKKNLLEDDTLSSSQKRVAKREFVDSVVQNWIASQIAADVSLLLEKEGIACGPIVLANELDQESNLRHRGFMPDAPIRIIHNDSTQVVENPIIKAWLNEEQADESLPLNGLKVLEIGQYTTAPFISRHLGAFGASVLKIEPPVGDATRGWAPQKNNKSFFFAMSNTDKSSLCLDLSIEKDMDTLMRLIASADVLVENLKPGSLARLGLDQKKLAGLNKNLIYCAVSGFGLDSVYPGRPAFDTVIQAMSGIMDLTRVNGVPQKNGISLADTTGGLFGLVGIISILYEKNQVSQNMSLVDISMQDAAAWLTQWPRNCSTFIYECADGYLSVDTLEMNLPIKDKTRAEAIEYLQSLSIQAVKVSSINDIAQHPQVLSRSLLKTISDSSGIDWKVFNNPMRLLSTPAKVRRVIGDLGETNSSLMKIMEWPS